jgi:hypothetical protein
VSVDWTELAQLDELILEARTVSDETPAGARLMIRSLEQRRTRLMLEALDQAEETARHLDLVLSGAPVTARGAEVGVVAGLLSSVQGSLTALAQSIAARPTSRGLVPMEIQDLVRLRLSMALPGSVALRLVPAKTDPALWLTDLFGEEVEPLLDASVERLIDVLNAASDPDENLLHSLAAAGPRTTGHLRDLSRLLADSRGSVALHWRAQGEARAAELQPETAAALHGLLLQTEEESEEIVVTGRIVGGSLLRRKFELELPDETVLTGAVAESVLPDLQRLFGRPCTATLEVRRIVVRGGETQEAHSLLSLSD